MDIDIVHIIPFLATAAVRSQGTDAERGWNARNKSSMRNVRHFGATWKEKNWRYQDCRSKKKLLSISFSPSFADFFIYLWMLSSSFYISTHCSKSPFFVQKFNFDFPRKLSIFWVKNSWKCCDFGLFNCWQLWFHEKNWQKRFGWKTRENVGVLSKLVFWTKIWLFE